MNYREKIRGRQSGFSMVEVLVTLIILLVGLLGLAGLMVQSQRSEMESYQRVQALILLQDMVGRINANRAVASCYAFSTAATGPYLGVAATAAPAACATGTAAQNTQVAADLAAWDNLLKGAAEASSGGTQVGAMVGARGCVSYDAATALIDTNTGAAIPGTGLYAVVVAWQGMGNTFANTTALCAQNQYGNEAMRRIVIQNFRLGSLG